MVGWFTLAVTVLREHLGLLQLLLSIVVVPLVGIVTTAGNDLSVSFQGVDFRFRVNQGASFRVQGSGFKV